MCDWAFYSKTVESKDMLHSHVLPQHVEYGRLLQNARYIVLDEDCFKRVYMSSHYGTMPACIACKNSKRCTSTVEPLVRMSAASSAGTSFTFLSPFACVLSSGHAIRILTRLRRLVDEALLQFVACSATVANPGESPGKIWPN